MSDNYLYHVTYATYLESIASGGIAPGMGSSMGGNGLDTHKAGRVFVTEGAGVSFWYGRSHEWAYDGYDDWAEIGLIPVVIRFVDEHGDVAEEDEIGSRDSRADAWMIEGTIDEDLEVYFDGEWYSLDDWDVVDTSMALDEDGDMHSDDTNPLFPGREYL